jgi:parallel beta-helix repeat protein
MRRRSLVAYVVASIFVASLMVGEVEVTHGTDINPSDGIVRGVWRIVDSPFHVKTDVYVPTDDSLTIEPGVTVYFDGYYNLTVRGKIVAAGTAGNRITFAWKDGGTERNRWQGIYLYSATRASTISYCYIMNARIAISAYGSFNNILTFNILRYDCAGIVVRAAEGNVITDNEIYEISDSAICLQQGCQRNEIARNIIYKIGQVTPLKGEGVVINGSVGSALNIGNKIRDNTIYNCYLSGLSLNHVQDLEITGNLMYANYQRGVNGTGGNIYIKMTGDPFLEYENKDIVIHNNRVHSAAGNGSGIYMQSARNVRITYNDIYLNAFAGIVVWNVTSLCQVNRNNIRNNAVHEAWDNGVTMTWDDGSRGNYWGNYTGFDYNNDGIGDIPYTLDGPKKSKDYFPLMNPQLFIVTTVSTATTRTSTGTQMVYVTTTTTTISTWSATTTLVPATSTTYVHTANATTTSTTTTTTDVTYTISVFTFYATSTSYIWTVSVSTTTTLWSSTSTSTTTTITTTSTSTSTTTSTVSTTTTVTRTETRTVTPGRCLIASASYGSELSPHVQFLRDFRDQQVLKSYAGSQFMRAFNAFYYSFSPAVAELISQSASARAAARALLAPLLFSLGAGETAFRVCPSFGELDVLVAGLVSSSLLGLLYASPLIALGTAKADDKRRGRVSLKPLALVWVSSLLALGLSYVLLYVGQVGMAEFVAMVSTGTLVLSTMLLSPLLLLRLVRTVLSRIRRS